ncbi:unnamed protein product [Hymenolepis diminuta]|uniref:Uncharacterized protein n=1 Tax=Hymenolepis diminuta TaxID=6216 RepID=A0A564YX96_HYMDI|nr:unnamed protein product [Hymenolepis diminuta]
MARIPQVPILILSCFRREIQFGLYSWKGPLLNSPIASEKLLKMCSNKVAI